tara:strand:- start:6051 stop:6896 length:846 start_codon:yes stop_codon:yes gene_type:complete
MSCVLTSRGEADSVDCGIFQYPTSEVEIDELPSTWDMGGVLYNTITLPCGHHFHPSAIALHFLTHSMTCPVCRRGFDECMQLKSIPKEMRDAFQRKRDGIESRSEQEDALVDMLHAISIDILDFERELCLVVDISTNTHSRAILQTPVHAVQEEYTGSYAAFRTQQSFQRILNHNISRFRGNSSISIVFSIQHPVMYFPVQTARMSLPTLFEQSSTRRAIPFHVHDNTDQHRVVATLILSPSADGPGAHHLGLYLDRENMGMLCVMCIQSHLQQLVYQQQA